MVEPLWLRLVLAFFSAFFAFLFSSFLLEPPEDKQKREVGGQASKRVKMGKASRTIRSDKSNNVGKAIIHHPVFYHKWVV